MENNTKIRIKLIETMCDAIVSKMFNVDSVKSSYNAKSDTLNIKAKSKKENK